MDFSLPAVLEDYQARVAAFVEEHILPLEAAVWADRVVHLLENQDQYRRFSTRARAVVSGFTHDRAAQGILDAVAYVQQATP